VNAVNDFLSRREFLVISAVAAATHVLACGRSKSIPPIEGDGTHFDECQECGGLGAVVCPACDGTGRWTEASESAGHYQREAARKLGSCAWCNDSGEAQCQECEGTGLSTFGLASHG
jgi:hypothetical protein